jgi:hypothetical protein
MLHTPTQRQRMFIAFSLEALAISACVCFHGHSKREHEGGAHMKLSTNDQKLMLCVTAAAGNHALLG